VPVKWASSRRILPLAEGILRGRGVCLRAERPAQPFREQERIAYLEKKNQTKEEVLAELMAEPSH
jgi:hypothetical protein